MGNRIGLCAVVALLGACFDEGGNNYQTQAANSTAQGLIAFQDISDNLETDPAVAGEALLEFIKTPIAAQALVTPPFESFEKVMGESARTAPSTPVPECIAKTGKPACDNFTAADCEAGGFTFSGTAVRRCDQCDKPEGNCTYAWSFPKLSYSSSVFTLELNTRGTWSGTASSIRPNLQAGYTLDLSDGSTGGIGTMRACACTNFTVQRSNTPSGKPKKLVNSSFVVQVKVLEGNANCALVKFDAQGAVSVANSCACEDGTTCDIMPVAECGDGFCDVGEDETSCPSDCTGATFCGDGFCDNNEDSDWCPTDCTPVEAECGNARCEIGEDRDTCPADCNDGMTP